MQKRSDWFANETGLRVFVVPWALMLDKWRSGVFNGKKEELIHLGEAKKTISVLIKMERSEEYFDPGAKYHIPGNIHIQDIT